MKTLVLLFACCLPAIAQDADAIKYAPRQILLVDPTPDVEPVLPMIFTVDGQQQLKYVPVSEVKAANEKGAHPITLGALLALLGQNAQQISQLKSENERLWKVAMKDKPETVVVQQSAVPTRAQIEAQEQVQANANRQQMLMMLLGRSMSYQPPAPVNPYRDLSRPTQPVNCISNRTGDTTYTNCN